MKTREKNNSILQVYDKNGTSGVKEVVSGIKLIQKKGIPLITLCLRNIEEKNESNVNEIYSNTSLKYDPRSFFEFIKIVNQNNVKIIHSHQAKSLIYSVLYKFFYRGVVLIQHEHGQIFQEKFWYRSLLRFCKNKVAIFIPVSKAIQERLINDIGVTQEKITVLHNFVNLERFDYNRFLQTKYYERIKLGIPEDVFLVGFAGRLIERKGWTEFVSVAKILIKENKNIFFIIAGDGVESENLIATLKEDALESRIIYLGRVKNMPWFYSLLDCFVMPSHWEGLPMVQLEVASMKIPLISAKSIGCDEIFEAEKECLYFETKNVNDLKEKINSLYSSESLRNSLATCAFYRVNNFTLDKYLTKIKRVYEKF